MRDSSFKVFCNIKIHKIRDCAISTEIKVFSDSSVIFSICSITRTNPGFASLRYTIGSKNSSHFFIQSEVKPKPIVTRSHAFSRALRQLHVTTSSFDWLTGLSVSFVPDWLELLHWFFDYRHSIKNCSSSNGSTYNLFTYSPVQHVS